MFDSSCFDPHLLETLITLITKVDNPVRFGEFRPISLCNVVYKLITKVLVNRLHPFSSSMVGSLQSSFIPARGTTDNVIVALEIVHYMQKFKDKKGSMVFKIDLKKLMTMWIGISWRKLLGILAF